MIPLATLCRWQEQIILASTPINIGGGAGVLDTCQITWTWGNEYFDGGVGSFAGHGLRISLSHTNAFAAPPISRFSFTLPHLDIRIFDSIPGWITLTELLDAPGTQLLAPSCNAWALNVAGLTWDLNGTRYVDTGPWAIAGGGYDPRLNKLEIAASGELDQDFPRQFVNCSDSNFESRVTGSAVGGFQYDPGTGFVRPAVDIKSSYKFPNMTPCDCRVGEMMPTGTDSWGVTIPYDAYAQRYETDRTVVSCECTGTSGPADFYHWYKYFDVGRHTNRIAIMPESAGILDTETERFSICFNNDTPAGSESGGSSDILSTEAHTLCKLRHDGNKMLATSECTQQVGPPFTVCTGIHEDEHYDCHIPPQKWCYSEGRIEIDWPTGPCTPCTSNPWNFHDQLARYHETCTRNQDVVYHFSIFQIPHPGWDIETVVTSSGDCAYPRSCVLPDLSIWLVYERFFGGAYSCYRQISYDNSKTWSGETAMAIANGRRPTNGYASDGTYYEFAFVYNSGTSGPGKIKGQVQRPGDLALSSVFTIVDDTGSELVFADDSFNVEVGKVITAPWTLHAVINGEAATSRWQSFDFGRSYKRVT